MTRWLALALACSITTACGGAPAEEATTADEEASELRGGSLTAAEITRSAGFAPPPAPGSCVPHGHWLVDFVTSRVTGEACIDGHATTLNRSLSADEVAALRSALSKVRKAKKPRSCPTDVPVTTLAATGAGSVTRYVDARSACDRGATPAGEAGLAKVVDALEALSGAGTGGGQGGVVTPAGPSGLEVLALIENMPSITDPAARFAVAPTTGELALFTMRRGMFQSADMLVGTLVNARHMQRYRIWDLRAKGGQLIDYLYDPGLKEMFIRVTEGKRTGFFGPWPVNTAWAEPRVTQAELTLFLPPLPGQPPRMDWYDRAIEHALLEGTRFDELLVSSGLALVVDNGPLALLPNDPRIITTP